jgi:hypothetical protein
MTEEEIGLWCCASDHGEIVVEIINKVLPIFLEYKDNKDELKESLEFFMERLSKHKPT